MIGNGSSRSGLSGVSENGCVSGCFFSMPSRTFWL